MDQQIVDLLSHDLFLLHQPLLVPLEAEGLGERVVEVQEFVVELQIAQPVPFPLGAGKGSLTSGIGLTVNGKLGLDSRVPLVEWDIRRLQQVLFGEVEFQGVLDVRDDRNVPGDVHSLVGGFHWHLVPDLQDINEGPVYLQNQIRET